MYAMAFERTILGVLSYVHDQHAFCLLAKSVFLLIQEDDKVAIFKFNDYHFVIFFCVRIMEFARMI